MTSPFKLRPQYGFGGISDKYHEYYSITAMRWKCRVAQSIVKFYFDIWRLPRKSINTWQNPWYFVRLAVPICSKCPLALTDARYRIYTTIPCQKKKLEQNIFFHHVKNVVWKIFSKYFLYFFENQNRKFSKFRKSEKSIFEFF